ncbi:MAG: hypothetical protein KDA71_20385, partial [Planctomycetales bacterium]|nr:hypothetical protein [Planctomycetales bacterium]
MMQNRSFVRKVVYISLMAVLLLPLAVLSQPSTNKRNGGVLAQKREQFELSQSDLGEIDPASETMKLATMGMQGVACAILWNRANELQKKESWDELAAVLKQISKLQPHFINVWIFQSWNQSYNVSVEFDDYKYRYHWVKKGVDYLIEGTRYNQRDVRLLWHLGWTFGHKFGRSDEKVQFRRLFHADRDFHEKLPFNLNDPSLELRDWQGNIDNWLVSRETFLRAQRLAESPRGSKRLGQSELLFYSEAPMQLMAYATAIEEEGCFEEEAGAKWKQAGEDWDDYGDRLINTSASGIAIRLGHLDAENAKVDRLVAELDAVVGEVRKQVVAERLAELSDEERELFNAETDSLPVARQYDQKTLRAKIEPNFEGLADRLSPEQRKQAKRLFTQLADQQSRASFTRLYRQQVNYDYWKTRTLAEQTQTMVDARRLVWEADRLYHQEAKLASTVDPVTGQTQLGAKEAYEEAFEKWAETYHKYPIMLDNPDAEDLRHHITAYAEVLGHLEQEMPAPFVLQMVLDMFDELGQRRAGIDWEVVAQAIADGRYDMPDANSASDPRSATPHPPTVSEEDVPAAETPEESPSP